MNMQYKAYIKQNNYVYISQITSIIKFEWKLSLFANNYIVVIIIIVTSYYLKGAAAASGTG